MEVDVESTSAVAGIGTDNHNTITSDNKDNTDIEDNDSPSDEDISENSQEGISSIATNVTKSASDNHKAEHSVAARTSDTCNFVAKKNSMDDIFEESDVKSLGDQSDVVLDFDNSRNGTRSGASTPSVTYASTATQAKDDPRLLKLHNPLPVKSATMKKKPKGILKHNSICVDVVDTINLPQAVKASRLIRTKSMNMDIHSVLKSDEWPDDGCTPGAMSSSYALHSLRRPSSRAASRDRYFYNLSKYN